MLGTGVNITGVTNVS